MSAAASTRRGPGLDYIPGMSLYVVDVEADGPIPGKYSMVSFGAVLVEPGLGRTFYGRTRPISDAFLPEALAISGVSREEHLRHDEPAAVMEAFERWIAGTTRGKPVLLLGQPRLRLAVRELVLPHVPRPEPLRLERPAHRRPLLRHGEGRVRDRGSTCAAPPTTTTR